MSPTSANKYMLKKFQAFTKKEQLFDKKDKVLLAVSGGRDSMAMAYLFQQAGYTFGIAHCNFQLRGAASDADEALVAAFAKQHSIPYHSIQFNTQAAAKQQKTSTQIVARTLRYDWFEQLRKEHDYDYIATAHHLNDSLETVLYNLTKGCGIRGLHGIPLQQKHIIRPLLFATRKDVNAYVLDQEIPYRDDASNETTKYHRNLIRHKVIPELETINPSLEKTFASTMRNIKDTEILFKEMIEQYKAKISRTDKGLFYLQKEPIAHHPAKQTILYELLRPYGFNNSHIEQIFQSYQQVGATFFSPSHQLLIDRTELIIQSIISKKENYIKVKKENKKVIFNNQALSFTIGHKKDYALKQPPNIALLDYAKLSFPLTLRYWQAGDRFQPLGMQGRSKKLQDYFSDLKLSRFEKEAVLILESGGEICWVVGYRMDERFKILESTEKVFVVHLG